VAGAATRCAGHRIDRSRHAGPLQRGMGPAPHRWRVDHVALACIADARHTGRRNGRMKGRWRRAAAIIRFIVKYRDLAASALDGQPDPAQTRARAESFREDLVALGPAFIKIGQFLSSHVDFLPESWAGELESLQEGIEPSPFDHVR